MDTVKKVFIWVTALLLLLTAIAKIAAAFGGLKILSVPNNVFPSLSTREVVLIAAGFELTTVAFVVKSRNNRAFQLLAIGWLSLIFICYRLQLALGNFWEPCPCLGRIPEAIGLDPAFAEAFTKYLLAFMFLGSWGLLAWVGAAALKRRIVSKWDANAY